MFSLFRQDQTKNPDKQDNSSQSDTPDPSRFRRVELDDGRIMYIDIEKSREAMRRAMESVGIE